MAVRLPQPPLRLAFALLHLFLSSSSEEETSALTTHLQQKPNGRTLVVPARQHVTPPSTGRTYHCVKSTVWALPQGLRGVSG